MNKSEQQHLKDLVFRGTFFVILVYVLVFLYNTGILAKLTGKAPGNSSEVTKTTATPYTQEEYANPPEATGSVEPQESVEE